MAERRKLTQEEINNELHQVPGWAVVGEKLHRELRFGSFVEAFGFMTRVALIAERKDHHPDWSNVYDRVIIDLNTHDVGGLSRKDFELARAINRLLESKG